MTRKLYIESSICALQNRGGYLRVSVLDNPLYRIYCTLSWLLAAASAFVCTVGGPALGVVVELPSRHLYSEQRAFGAYNPNNAAMLHVTHQRCIQRE